MDTATLPSGSTPVDAPTSATWRAIGTTNRIHVTDPRSLVEATALATDHLARLDEAVSRFRPDSEVSRLAARAATGDAWCFASPLFADHVRAALRAARLSGGLVDPTIGSAVVASGYDADLDVVRSRPAVGDVAVVPAATRVLGWRQVVLEEGTDRLSTPRGVLLDLGATAKAHAADVLAAILAGRLPGGFLVNLGGDIAVAGEVPEGGWRVGVQAVDGQVRQVVVTTGQAIATSSTQHRTWTAADGTVRHHILDPRTGRTAPSPWAQVSCVAANALEANTASTAAIVLGESAPDWLEAHGIPARLDHLDGSVRTTPGWPDPAYDLPKPMPEEERP